MSNQMVLSSIFAIVATGLSLVSAGLWCACYFVDVPKGSIWIQGPVGHGAPNPEIDKLVSAVRQQSKLNGWAAGFAGLAAIMGALAVFTSHVLLLE